MIAAVVHGLSKLLYHGGKAAYEKIKDSKEAQRTEMLGEGALCPKCGQKVQPGTQFCPRDGTPITRGCPSCGQHNAPANRFCSKCGVSFS